MSIATAFKRLHYPTDVIVQCVRWYLAYSLSLRNLEKMMSERGITVDHSTLHRWVFIHFTNEFQTGFEQVFVSSRGSI